MLHKIFYVLNTQNFMFSDVQRFCHRDSTFFFSFRAILQHFFRNGVLHATFIPLIHYQLFIYNFFWKPSCIWWLLWFLHKLIRFLHEFIRFLHEFRLSHKLLSLYACLWSAPIFHPIKIKKSLKIYTLFIQTLHADEQLSLLCHV